MVSITLSVADEYKAELKRFSWVNWSELAREELLKKDIFEQFMKTRKLSEEDTKFCEAIDWHPVDELPLKEEYVKKLKEAESGSHEKINAEELDSLLGLK
ncbi:MAG: hypothetical protein V1859_06705 [archaeon]